MKSILGAEPPAQARTKISLHIASQTHGQQKPRPSRIRVLHVVCAGVEPTRLLSPLPLLLLVVPLSPRRILAGFTTMLLSANVVSQAGVTQTAWLTYATHLRVVRQIHMHST